jgi:LmbE family N-acetylglucosaminyl deacetylase
MKKLFVLSLALLITSPAFGFWSRYVKKQLKNMPELKHEYPVLPNWETGTILMVYAHADDELGIVSQIAKLQKENPALKIKWVMVSDNAKGVTFPGTCRGKTKAKCRLDEAYKAARCMGIPEPISLNLPDGGLHKIPDLAQFIRDHVKEFDDPELRAVFANDYRGLYGHADHVAVHDAVAEIMREKDVPLIGMAVPDFIQSRLPMRSPGKDRERMPITHALDLTPEDAQLKGCVVRAHRSQILTLRLLMLQLIRPEDVYTWAPREFFTVLNTDI